MDSEEEEKNFNIPLYNSGMNQIKFINKIFLQFETRTANSRGPAAWQPVSRKYNWCCILSLI